MPRDLEARRHFAIPVYGAFFDGFDEHRAALTRLVHDVRETHPSVELSNRHAYHSPANIHLRSEPVVHWLLREIITFARSALAEDGFDRDRFDLALGGLWFNVSGRGGFHAPHHHHPANWSGVFYLAATAAVPDPRGPDASGKLEFVAPFTMAVGLGTQQSVLYTPEDGMCLLFPAGLLHLTHPNRTDAERISFSFNLVVEERRRAPDPR